MKLHVAMELMDVYGGDGETRVEQVTEKKLKRTRKTTRTRSDLGLSSEDSMDESKVDKVEREVQTFRKDAADVPMIRLGGAHGKLWGALLEAGKRMYALKAEGWSNSYRPFVEMIQISPVWVSMKLDGSPIEMRSMAQELGGPSGGMITILFDVVPKCLVEFDITYPDEMDSRARALLAQLEMMALFNKRRATASLKSLAVVPLVSKPPAPQKTL